MLLFFFGLGSEDLSDKPYARWFSIIWLSPLKISRTLQIMPSSFPSKFYFILFYFFFTNSLGNCDLITSHLLVSLYMFLKMFLFIFHFIETYNIPLVLVLDTCQFSSLCNILISCVIIVNMFFFFLIHLILFVIYNHELY